jgi:protein gp37
MADKTEIEWTDATWNPLRGCTRISGYPELRSC